MAMMWWFEIQARRLGCSYGAVRSKAANYSLPATTLTAVSRNGHDVAVEIQALNERVRVALTQ